MKERIILITGLFPIYERGIPTGKKEFVVSHGIGEESGKNYILPSESPERLGAKFDEHLCEWYLTNDTP